MEASGSNGHVESNFKSKSKSNKAKHQKSHKPNPFLALHQLAIQQREEKRAAIEAAKKEREEKKQKREKYYADRNRTKKMLNERTGRGQPVMKNVVDVLLEKIKKGS
ncbi:hypothetical protein BKA69DRAFT_1103536 [Paraphysoderma sedebokerense]|nr:hypothetical protein BKA69DRAFT_1103536 [Paraphysoderma sedebokerense]